jgi:hypothetical protein
MEGKNLSDYKESPVVLNTFNVLKKAEYVLRNLNARSCKCAYTVKLGL